MESKGKFLLLQRLASQGAYMIVERKCNKAVAKKRINVRIPAATFYETPIIREKARI